MSQHWTEEAIATALEGRFYRTDGRCRNEDKLRVEEARRKTAQAARAVRAQRREMVVEIVAENGSHSPAAIIAAVAHAHQIGVADLVSRSRARHIIHARMHACALIRELTGLSLQRIADAVGLVDHSTAHHAIITWRRRGHVYALEDANARKLLGVEVAA